ncbi:MAG: hypothetical protein HYV27_02630 [Candidatus Hydrogenedentes bacterium]|nr:hypothetical protein [Candidatus Hydrogenedentota bacterium]
MKCLCFITLLIWCVPGMVIAQPEPDAAPEGKKISGKISGGKSLKKGKEETGAAETGAAEAGEAKAGEKAEGGAAKPKESGIELPGDVIVLKTGSRLTGVQILKRTPKSLEVEVVEGEEPMSISLKMVESIEWDEIDPIKMRREKEKAAANAPDNVLEGQELSPDLLNKLNAAISETESPFDDPNFVKVVRDFAQKVGVEVVVSEGVKKLPADRRPWKGVLPPKATLQDLLSIQLVTAFPQLRVNYPFDKVELALKDEPPAAPAPGDAPAPAPEGPAAGNAPPPETPPAPAG